MIYLDTSVALAHLLSEDRRPPDVLWTAPLVSSRLLEYELWSRIHGRGLSSTHENLIQSLLSRVAILELIGEVLERARRSFPEHVRTLDALHLASADFLRAQGVDLSLATYDARMLTTAAAMGIPVYPFP